MMLQELLERTGLPARTLRHYTQHGLLPQPEGKHDDHGYGEEHVLRIFAIYRLQEQGIRQLREMAIRLDAMSVEQLRRFVGEEDADAEEGRAEQATRLTAAVTGPTPAAMPPPPAVNVASTTGFAGMNPGLRETWTQVALRPGLVLAVRHGASDDVRALARSIGSLCGIDVSID